MNTTKPIDKRLIEVEKRLKDLENYVYNFDDFLPARSLVDKAKNYIEKLEEVSASDLTKRFHIPETRAKKLIELFIEYGFLINDDKGVLKTNKEAFKTYFESPFYEKDDDTLLNKSIEIIGEFDRVSASLLQRRLSIGYARAANILNLLEAKGFVGPAEGSKPREILKRS